MEERERAEGGRQKIPEVRIAYKKWHTRAARNRSRVHTCERNTQRLFTQRAERGADGGPRGGAFECLLRRPSFLPSLHDSHLAFLAFLADIPYHHMPPQSCALPLDPWLRKNSRYLT